MTDQPCGGDGPSALAAPTRNRYFNGKLLDALHLEMEQDYVRGKLRLLNRLGLGSGILCGLEVVPTQDGVHVRVGPGVAVDACGREIVVPAESRPIDPTALTDACGRATGQKPVGDMVTLCLSYHECEADMVPVVLVDCATERGCAPSSIRERYHLTVRDGLPAPATGLLPEQCGAIFPDQPDDGFDRRLTACEVLSGPCPTPSDDCVVLATIRLAPGGPVAVDGCAHRRMLYSNAMLWELILCLAERVDRCCGGRPPVTLDPPVVNAIWPRNAAMLTRGGAVEEREAFNNWIEQPRLEITFSRRMDPGMLGQPETWLRLWRLRPPEQGRIPLTFVKLAHAGPTATGVLNQAGVTERFDLPAAAATELTNSRFLVQIRSQGGLIVDAGTPGIQLDADFAGTRLNLTTLNQIWDVVAQRAVPLAVLDALVDTGKPLPRSGDGTEGGRLHSWFQVVE